MKKLFCILAIFVSLAGLAYGQSCKSSGELTTDSLVYAGPVYVCGIFVVTDGTNDARVIIYDNTAASGTVKWEQTVIGGDNYGGVTKFRLLKFDTGIYVDVNGTGASYFIEYSQTDR